jgi:hypothetical protein
MLRELLEVVANATVPTADQALPLNYWVWDWHLFVGSFIFIIGGSMSASVGIGGYVHHHGVAIDVCICAQTIIKNRSFRRTCPEPHSHARELNNNK